MHHQWNSSPPGPQSRLSHWRTVEVTQPSSEVVSSLLRGSCQQTSGFSSRGGIPRRARPCEGRNRDRQGTRDGSRRCTLPPRSESRAFRP